jgi:prevent-host-death family protein
MALCTKFRTKERIEVSTKIMPVSDLRRQTSAVLRQLQEDGDIVYITQHGRPAAVMLGHERYEALLRRARHQGWPVDYFSETYGALTDDPLSRPEQDEFEPRESLP